MVLSKVNKEKNKHNPKTDNEFWQGCGEIGILMVCLWKCKMMKPLWKTIWQFHKKLHLKLSGDFYCNTTSGSSPQRTGVCNPIHLAALIPRVEGWKEIT